MRKRFWFRRSCDNSGSAEIWPKSEQNTEIVIRHVQFYDAWRFISTIVWLFEVQSAPSAPGHSEVDIGSVSVKIGPCRRIMLMSRKVPRG